MPLWLIPVLRSKWLHIGLLALACGLLFIRGNHYKAKAENCAIGRQNDRQAFANAQVQAKAAQEALNSSIQARYEAAAKDSAREYQKALADAHSAAERYIVSHRVRAQAVGGSPVSTGNAAQGGNPGSPDGTAAETELVAVRAEDIRDCTVDYQYGRGAYDFMQKLIADGLAIPDPEFAN